MPCYKCSNGKYKYGENGRCQFDTLEACKAAEAAIHAREDKKTLTKEIKPNESTTRNLQNPSSGRDYSG